MKNSSTTTLYDPELDRVIQEVRSRKSRRILLQFPEGLLKYAAQIAERINQETGSEAIVSLDTCYGSCDLATYAASRLKADLLLHYGHAAWLGKPPIPTIYVEAFVSLDISTMLPRVKELLGNARRVGLLSTVQHIRQVGKVREFLEKNGFKAVIGKASGKVCYDGQVLGCDYSTARSISHNVDKFLLIGGGKFHAIGLALAVRRESIVVDPFSNEVFATKELLHRYLKSRYSCIMEARSVTSFGVIIGLKYGQFDLHRALSIREELLKSRKKVTLFCVDDLIPEQLNTISGIDAFVVTACPRIAIDDAELFKKPVLTPEEVEMVLSDELLEEYLSSN
nr:diphthamide biosynthesis enzyme Dph2 [Candidatus Njordarchaeum guaymaensis]